MGGGGRAPSGLAALQATAPDSATVLDRARSAQRSFEGVRLRYLPLIFSNPGGACDDRVGRMCWTHDSGSLRTPGPEDPRIAQARDTLLATLELLAAALPGDEWILGQRVAYLGEAGRWQEAGDLARACRGAPPWWCRALEGLALHRLGRYAAAGSAFDSALVLMEPDRAREWRDVRPLLDGRARDLIAEGTAWQAGEGDATVERLWSLSDPLYLVEGNDRRTEHLARRTLARVRSRARNPHGIRWGSDLEELLIRYGADVGWERNVASGQLRSETVSGFPVSDGRHYVPPGHVLAEPASVPAGSWVPGVAFARSAHTPAYAPVVLPMDASTHVFPRGDSALVVATYRLPADTTHRSRAGSREPFVPPAVFEGRPMEAGLFLVSHSSGEVHSVRRADFEGGWLLLRVPAGPYWTSVEVWDPSGGLAGRVRHGLVVPRVPPGVAALSDLLILDSDHEPVNLADAAAHILPRGSVRRGGRIRIAWEASGFDPREEPLAYRLSVRAASSGFFTRVGRWLGLAGHDRSGALEWEEEAPPAWGPELRSLVLDVPDLGGEELILRLELRTRGRGVLVSERRLRMESAGTR
jgi:hypothetical protein